MNGYHDVICCVIVADCCKEKSAHFKKPNLKFRFDSNTAVIRNCDQWQTSTFNIYFCAFSQKNSINIIQYVLIRLCVLCSMSSTSKSEKITQNEEKQKQPVVKDAYSLQRLKLEKLMKNPTKPVVLPETNREKKTPHVPEFVRNVMGSSAGAGSGEFHVYRHLRRKEHFRQKFIQEKAEKEILDEEYHKKLELNKQLAEERTAKKRAKRLKKKAKRQKNEDEKKVATFNETGVNAVKEENNSTSDSDA